MTHVHPPRVKMYRGESLDEFYTQAKRVLQRKDSVIIRCASCSDAHSSSLGLGCDACQISYCSETCLRHHGRAHRRHCVLFRTVESYTSDDSESGSSDYTSGSDSEEEYVDLFASLAALAKESSPEIEQVEVEQRRRRSRGRKTHHQESDENRKLSIRIKGMEVLNKHSASEEDSIYIMGDEPGGFPISFGLIRRSSVILLKPVHPHVPFHDTDELIVTVVPEPRQDREKAEQFPPLQSKTNTTAEKEVPRGLHHYPHQFINRAEYTSSNRSSHCGSSSRGSSSNRTATLSSSSSRSFDSYDYHETESRSRSSSNPFFSFLSKGRRPKQCRACDAPFFKIRLKKSQHKHRCVTCSGVFCSKCIVDSEEKYCRPCYLDKDVIPRSF